MNVRRGGVKADHERLDSVKYCVGRVRVLLWRAQYRGHVLRNIDGLRGGDSWDRGRVNERGLVVNQVDMRPAPKPSSASIVIGPARGTGRVLSSSVSSSSTC
jgi:hypothetical protein